MPLEPVSATLIVSAIFNAISFLVGAYQCSKSTCLYNTWCCRGDFTIEPSSSTSVRESKSRQAGVGNGSTEQKENEDSPPLTPHPPTPSPRRMQELDFNNVANERIYRRRSGNTKTTHLSSTTKPVMGTTGGTTVGCACPDAETPVPLPPTRTTSRTYQRVKDLTVPLPPNRPRGR